MFGELPKYEMKIVLEYFSGKRQMDETCYKEFGGEGITWKAYLNMGVKKALKKWDQDVG